MEKESVAKKCIPSLLLLIAGFVIAFILLENSSSRIVTSLLIGWLAGGFIWGWSLTKKWFPNTRIGDGLWGGALTTMVVSFRITIAFAVGAVAMPVGIIILIAASAKAGKDAYKEAASKIESAENSQENTNVQ